MAADVSDDVASTDDDLAVDMCHSFLAVLGVLWVHFRVLHVTSHRVTHGGDDVTP